MGSGIDPLKEAPDTPGHATRAPRPRVARPIGRPFRLAPTVPARRRGLFACPEGPGGREGRGPAGRRGARDYSTHFRPRRDTDSVQGTPERVRPTGRPGVELNIQADRAGITVFRG